MFVVCSVPTHNLKWIRLIVQYTKGIRIRWKLTQNKNILLKMHLELSFVKCRSFCWHVKCIPTKVISAFSCLFYQDNPKNIWLIFLFCHYWKIEDIIKPLTWWRHQMETFSALLAICGGIHRSPVNSPHKGQWRGALTFPLIWLNRQLSKQSWGWWFETPSCSLWRHCNEKMTSNGSWCIGIKGEMSGTVCVTFTWDIYIYMSCL